MNKVQIYGPLRMRETVIRTKLEKKIVDGNCVCVDTFPEWEMFKNEKDMIKLNKAFFGKNYFKILAFDRQSTVFDG